MDELIKIISAFAVVFGCLLTIGTTALTVYKIYQMIAEIRQKAKAPNVAQDESISELREQVAGINLILSKHNEFFDKDNKRLNRMEEGQKLGLKGTLDAIKAIQEGDNVNGLAESSKAINEFIWK